ncbi:MAG: hypothetical protein KGH69_01445 [Candidatus Micrarchaeota archaeon]|nr:hypothetical protein [Candidatus Micrarchaeota archaeon]
MAKFNPLEPFRSEKLFRELLRSIENFDFKLYGKRRMKFYRGYKSKYEFDLNLGVMHFTAVDFEGIDEIFKRTNAKWGTEITFCIYPAKERNRNMIMNVRSPKAPFEIG